MVKLAVVVAVCAASDTIREEAEAANGEFVMAAGMWMGGNARTLWWAFFPSSFCQGNKRGELLLFNGAAR